MTRLISITPKGILGKPVLRVYEDHLRTHTMDEQVTPELVEDMMDCPRYLRAQEWLKGQFAGGGHYA